MLEDILGHAHDAPGRVALKDDARELSYAQLPGEVALIASGLVERGTGEGDRVAIHLATSVDAVVTALACLWIGAIFVPLSPGDPAMRIGSILAESEPAVIVGDRGHAAYGDRSTASVEELRVRPGRSVGRAPEVDRPAYCIYTSGTTGTPKGVLVGTKSFHRAVEDVARGFGMGPHTKALCSSAFHFDGSFGTLFPVPCSGGTLNILRREPMILPRMFVRAVLEDEIDLAMVSPSFLRLLLSSADLAKLAGSPFRTLGLGGEAASAHDLLELQRVLPQVRVVNRYGPTETVMAVTSHEVDLAALEAGSPVPIGAPHPGVSFHLVGDDGGIVTSANRPGELFIGGDQLMEGYWRDPALTAEVLRADVVPGTLAYRSGDLVERNDRGDYVYLGRLDRVINRHGVRVSLDEIEGALRRLSGVTGAACVEVPDGEARIVAYVACAEPEESSTLSAGLREVLPSTMIPDEITVVASIPLKPSGKIDYPAVVRENAAG